ncbi:MAG: O-antigen ligase family protein [Vampirovibrio sp.]|nr:O-antigen ligase family protein [Vampirovibrio sp.]
MIRLDQIGHYVMLVLLFLLLLFNYGIIHIRIAGGVPITEAVLVFCMLCIHHKKVLPKFMRSPFILPLLAWWALGLGHLAIEIPRHGFWAIRDASHLIESFFIYVGFAFAGSKESIQKLNSALPAFFGVVILYACLYPIREFLWTLSPKLTGAQGQSIPMIGLYTDLTFVLTVCAAYLIQSYISWKNIMALIFGLFVILMALIIFPSRTLYLQTLIVFGFFFVAMNNRQRLTLMMVCAIAFVVFVGILSSGISINSRFGEVLSLSDYGQLFTELFVQPDPEDKVSSGFTDRLEWWGAVLMNWASTPQSIMIGSGFGMPLISHGSSQQVFLRDPHNDWITMLARMGLMGLVFFSTFITMLMIKSIATVKRYRKYAASAPLVVMLLFFLFEVLALTLGEPPFLWPFYTVPFYFSAGILARLYLMKDPAALEETLTPQPKFSIKLQHVMAIAFVTFLISI